MRFAQCMDQREQSQELIFADGVRCGFEIGVGRAIAKVVVLSDLIQESSIDTKCLSRTCACPRTE